MKLIVRSKLQVMDHSGGKAKIHELEPGEYPGQIGPPPQNHDRSNAWFYVGGRNAVGAALSYLRELNNSHAELIET